MDIITEVVKHTTDSAQKEEIVNFIPSLANLMMKCDDTAFLNHATICLKTFVIYTSEQILKQ